jgi:hypothetical protein
MEIPYERDVTAFGGFLSLDLINVGTICTNLYQTRTAPCVKPIQYLSSKQPVRLESRYMAAMTSLFAALQGFLSNDTVKFLVGRADP